MPTPIQLIPSIAPELAGLGQQLEDMLALAELELGTGLCPDLRPYIVANLAAHNVTMANRGGNAGAITSAREGALGLSYAETTSTKSPYGQTPYGLKCQQLLKQCLGGLGFRTAVMP